MRLSVQTDYALRTLIFLALNDGHHSIADIAGAYKISRNHLMKVAQRLVSEGFVESVKGRNGGLRLARPATQINVGAIFRRMESTGTFVECFDPMINRCVISPTCGLQHALVGAVEAFARHLDQFTIAHIIRDMKRFPFAIEPPISAAD